MSGALGAATQAATAGLDFTAFYEANHGPVFRALALTLRDRELAGEAADEAMTRACQRWAAVSHHANPAGWVFRVGLNWACSRLRRLRREVLGAQRERATWDAPLRDPQIERAVAGLPADQRAVVVLRLVLDWSTEDVAAALELPTGTVKSRLHRALARLRAELEEDS